MTIELRTEGLSVVGWKSLSITRGLEELPASFSLEAAQINIPTSEPPGPTLPLLATKPCEVFVRGQRVLTGYVDGDRQESRANQRDLSVRGRSKVQDVYDCTASLTETKKGKTTWRDKPLQKIVTEIVSPFGVETVFAGDMGPKVPTFTVQRAERAFEALQRLCQPRGLMITDDPEGRLVITRVGRTRSATAIEEGGNAKAVTQETDASQLYSVYYVADQLAVPSDAPAQYTALQKQFVPDDTMDRFRPLEIIPPARTSGQRAKDLARHEAAVRAGRAVTASAEVTGWTKTEDGEIWRENELIQVVAPGVNLWAELLAVSVTYDMSIDGGEITTFRLGPESGYELLTEPERAKAGKRRATFGAGSWKELGEAARRGAVDGMTAKRPDSSNWWFTGTIDLRRGQR